MHRGIWLKRVVLSLSITELVIELVQSLIRALSDFSNFDQDSDSAISILNPSSMTFAILRRAWRTAGVMGLHSQHSSGRKVSAHHFRLLVFVVLEYSARLVLLNRPYTFYLEVKGMVRNCWQ